MSLFDTSGGLDALRRIDRETQIRKARDAASGLRDAQDAIRLAHERQASVYAQVETVTGFVQITGAGELTVDVNFPARFLEKPAMSGAGELMEGQVLVAGALPTFSLVISKWKMEELDRFRRYYVGATLVVVTTGPAAQRMWGHWQATGVALLAPKGESDIAI